MEAPEAKASQGPRLTAAQRKRSVLAAAVTEFARGGYAGTSTEQVAARAGISQPYLFRLFGTKRDLFVATMAVMHERIEETFTEAADGLSGLEALAAMGESYRELLGERELLQLQLHSYAASDDEVIGKAAREGFRHLWNLVGRITGLTEEIVRAFFAEGMLMNVLAAFDAQALDESWAEACERGPGELPRILALLPERGS